MCEFIFNNLQYFGEIYLYILVKKNPKNIFIVIFQVKMKYNIF